MNEDIGGPTPEEEAEAYRHQPRKRAKVTLVGGGTYIDEINQLQGLFADLGDGEVGEVWHVEVVELSDAEMEELGDFPGH